MKKSGYRLHIKGEKEVPSFNATMKEVLDEQKMLAKKYGYILDHIKSLSYIQTEEDFQSEVAEHAKYARQMKE